MLYAIESVVLDDDGNAIATDVITVMTATKLAEMIDRVFTDWHYGKDGRGIVYEAINNMLSNGDVYYEIVPFIEGEEIPLMHRYFKSKPRDSALITPFYRFTRFGEI